MIDQLLHRGHLAPVQRAGLLLDKVKEAGLFDERYLDGLSNPASPISIRKCGQKIEVVQDGKRWREGPDKIFLPECIDAVFNTDPGIVLCKHRGGNSNEPHTSMCGRSRVPNHIEKCSAAYRYNKRVPADPRIVYRLLY